MAGENKIFVRTLLAQTSARNVALGFVLVGLLMGSLGGLSVSWRYQFEKDPRLIGFQFFAFDAALLIGGLFSHSLAIRRFLKSWSVAACLLACAGFVGLTFVPFAEQILWRTLGIIVLGLSAGLLFSLLLRPVRPLYDQNAVSALVLCGSAFGIGALLASLIIAGAYGLYNAQWETLFLAAAPFALLFSIKNVFSAAGMISVPPGKSLPQQKSIPKFGIILFALLLFFQFGNEWALANWLPLLLIHRLGISPQFSIYTLALYFLALAAGRLLALSGRRYASHTSLLIASVLTAMLGYLLLSFTVSPFGAALAAIVTGLALGPIYALAAETIGRRFDSRPGAFKAVFACAIGGGMLLPWLLGFVAYDFGMQALLIVPSLGSIVVFALMLLLILEGKLTGKPKEAVKEEKPLRAKTMAARAGKRF